MLLSNAKAGDEFWSGIVWDSLVWVVKWSVESALSTE
jgi:hypothetical protein